VTIQAQKGTFAVLVGKTRSVYICPGLNTSKRLFSRPPRHVSGSRAQVNGT